MRVYDFISTRTEWQLFLPLRRTITAVSCRSINGTHVDYFKVAVQQAGVNEIVRTPAGH